MPDLFDADENRRFRQLAVIEPILVTTQVVGVTSGTFPNIVMELCQRGDLLHVLRHEPLTLADRFRFCQQVGRGAKGDDQTKFRMTSISRVAVSSSVDLRGHEVSGGAALPSPRSGSAKLPDWRRWHC